MSQQVIEGSEIQFFKNGAPLGVAFRDISEGELIGLFSLIMFATLIFNFLRYSTLQASITPPFHFTTA
jgi:hypothetical protein